MAKIRVHELAKEIGIPSKEMVDILQNLGMNVKNHMSTMEDTQAKWVKKRLSEKSLDADPDPPQPGIDKSLPPSETPKSSISKEDTAKSEAEMKSPKAEARTETVGSDHRPQASRTDSRPQGARSDSRPQGARSDSRPQGARSDSRPQGARSDSRPQGARSDSRPQGARSDSRPQGARSDSRPQGARSDSRPQGARSDSRPQGARSDSRPQGARSDSRPQGARSDSRPQANRPDTRPQIGRSEGTVLPKDSMTVPKDKTSQYRNGEPSRNNEDVVEAKSNRGRSSKAGKQIPKNQMANVHKGQQQGKKDYSRPQKKSKHKKKKVDVVLPTPELIYVDDLVTVRELADKLHKSTAEIVKKLMELGIMASINESIDFETAEIVASLYEVRVEHSISEEEKILEEIIDDEESLELRPPVVTVMGHVDHGKTSLLDRIRKADVASGEAGGITQHIGAYQVKINDNRITFIDTPGHEAFTAMRARGANLTDIVVLVVAADDGVMPQTVEAINHIKAAQVPFLVAINKIDKADANPDKVMQQLTEYQIVPEEWGGDTIFVPVSAKTGQGIDSLLEMILLVAEVNEIKANPNRLAEGVVIEGQLDKGRGAVATVLVLKGTLRIGDTLICGNKICRVRAMTDHRGNRVEEAYPSMPVEITGWSEVPEAGGKVQACDEKIAKEIINLRLGEKKLEEQKQSSRVSLDDFFKQIQEHELKELNLIIKGDVQGSIEALAQSLLRLSTDEVKVNVIHSAVGAISETDVMLASASNSIIIGFNVRPDNKARKNAEEENIDVLLYRVIYEAIDDVKKAMAAYQKQVQEEERAARLLADRLKREEAERLLAEAEKAIDEGREMESEILFAQAEIIETSTPAIQIQAPTAKGISTRTMYRARVIDESKVPIEVAGVVIRPVDLAAINKLAQASKGRVQIPGIEIYTEDSVAVRTR
jgi:translation initiation factor IF-2